MSRETRSGPDGAPPSRGETAARLHSAAIHLLRNVRHDDPESGLTPARLSALSVLVYGGPRPLGELAAAEQVTPPTMTRLAASLERDGFLERETSAEDGRVVIVRATEKAVRVLESARLRRIERLLHLLDGLTDEDWRTLEHATGLIERTLDRNE